MTRSALIWSLTVIMFIFPFHAASQDDSEEPEAERPTFEILDAWLPQFVRPEAKVAFDKGRELFRQKQWLSARRSFEKSANSLNAKGKAVLALWTKACKSGKKLDTAERSFSRGKHRQAWTALTKLLQSHANSPLMLHISPLRHEVHEQLFTVLANFEEPPPKTEEPADELPASAEYVTQGKYVRSGLRTLKWLPVAAKKSIVHLPLARFDGNLLETHKYLELELHSPDDIPHKYVVIFHLGTIEKLVDSRGSIRRWCFYTRITLDKQGWHQIRIDLKKDLRVLGMPTRPEVRGIILIPNSRDRVATTYVDDVRLARQ